MNKESKEMKESIGQESFEDLAQYLVKMNEAFQQSAASAVNKHVTCRNWLNGYYIVHYEQNGSDRATYGDNLIRKLAEKLHMKGYSYRDLQLYKQFYLAYKNLMSEIARYVYSYPEIVQSLIAQYGNKPLQLVTEPQEYQGAKIVQSVIAQSGNESIAVPPVKLFNRLSFTHFVQLLPIENPLERAFYEIECMKGVWSTRELKRQIESNYFKRSGLTRIAVA